MKTKDVKVNKSYLYKPTNEIVVVINKILGRTTSQRNMQSGVLFTGYKREQKSFKLNNGLITKANNLEELPM